ncbi:spidroin-2-like [Pteropus vampyrus]|uniref:Spidroin-2-like n=1 Tax=Pteropus vampyrus TaxID=132908 RepID=A0A6P6BL45_PTEVA|nr:spidroin-2-like [Pteropus vampyrus]
MSEVYIYLPFPKQRVAVPSSVMEKPPTNQLNNKTSSFPAKARRRATAGPGRAGPGEEGSGGEKKGDEEGCGWWGRSGGGGIGGSPRSRCCQRGACGWRPGQQSPRGSSRPSHASPRRPVDSSPRPPPQSWPSLPSLPSLPSPPAPAATTNAAHKAPPTPTLRAPPPPNLQPLIGYWPRRLPGNAVPAVREELPIPQRLRLDTMAAISDLSLGGHSSFLPWMFQPDASPAPHRKH